MTGRKVSPTIAYVAPSDRIELIARRALDNRTKAAGAIQWYETAGQWCAELAESIGHGLTREKVAAVVAALSPQNGWDDQLRWTEKQIRAALRALADGATIDETAAVVPGPGFRSNKRKAVRILSGDEPDAVLSGPKVSAFYRNLSGDLGPVTVDRHAIVIAWGEAAPASLTAKRYAEAAQAYTEAAGRLGLRPAQIQALTWVAHRDTINGAPW